jgi:hypothetical protein
MKVMNNIKKSYTLYNYGFKCVKKFTHYRSAKLLHKINNMRIDGL